MSFKATVLRVLIASPSDVPEERDSIPQILRRWNSRHAENKGIVLLPVSWEIDGTPSYELGKDGQEVLNRDIVDKCDIAIAVFYSRLGTPTLRADSGTIEELQRFVTDNKPVAVYFSDRPISPSAIDTDQLIRLRAFKDDFKKKGLGYEFHDIGNFREMLRDHIDSLVYKATEAHGSTASTDKKISLEKGNKLDLNEKLSRQVKIEVGLGISNYKQQKSNTEILGTLLGIPFPQNENKNATLLTVKAVNEGIRPVTITSWGINVSKGSIIPPLHKQCTSKELPARLEDGDFITGWIEYDLIKEHGFEFPRDKANVWVEDVSGNKWFYELNLE